MRESQLLAHIFTHAGHLDRFPHIIVGPGHDCAVIALPGGECALLKTDQVVEGLHFAPTPRTPVRLIARKAIARALSDIAAAGGTPLATLVGGVLPSDCTYAHELADALAHWAAHWSAPLVGGDTAIWKNTSQPTFPAPAQPLVLSISIVGVPHPVRGPVLRSGARPGDHIYTTGRLGGSFDHATSLGRHITFEPRLPEARFLCDLLGEDLHAMMDISDGLGRDAGRLAAASGVAINLDGDALPLAPGCTWRDALASGEDYELLFAASGSRELPPQCPGGTPLTRIGTVVAGQGCRIRAEGSDIDCAEMGYEHG